MTVTDPAIRAELRALAERSDRAAGLWLLRHAALILACGAAVVAGRGTWLVWPAMLALGIALMALFTPLHESTHRGLGRSVALNRAAGWVAGLILVLPPEWFRLFHMAHHRFTQDPARDPEIAGVPGLTRLRYAWRLTGLPYWIAEVRLLLRSAAGDARAPYVPPGRERAVVREARWFLAIYAALAAGSVALGTDWLLWLYVIPALLGQPFLRAFLMAEHAGLPRVPEMERNTRTTLAHRAVGILFWNANLHTAHHAVPGVPFHNLPRLHGLLAPRVAQVAHGYPAAHAQIRQAIGSGGHGNAAVPARPEPP